MKLKNTLLFLLVLAFVVAVAGCSSDNNGNGVKEVTTTKMNLSKTPDGTPLVEYHVSTPYSSDKDSWMKEYAQEHRTSSNAELHLFTFSDGKQFEYYMASAEASDKSSVFPANWTEEPNESLKPTKISEQQFQQNMKDILRNG